MTKEEAKNKNQEVVTLKLTLWLGIPTAIAGYVVGVESGLFFIPYYLEIYEVHLRGVRLSHEEVEYTLRGVLTIIALLFAGLGCTVRALVCIFVKWWHEWKHPGHIVASDFVDLGDEDGVSFLVFGFAMSAFLCGFFSPFFEEKATAVFVAIAILPTILQLIDMIGQRRRN